MCSFARSSFPVPLQVPEVYYETEILEAGETSQIGMGFTTTLPTQYDYKGINERTNAIALCCQTGNICNGNKTPFKAEVTVHQGDVIGCRLQHIKVGGVWYQIIQFYLNGKKIGVPQGSKALHPLYPSVWMASTGCILRMNSGKKEFQYKHGIGNFYFAYQ